MLKTGFRKFCARSRKIGEKAGLIRIMIEKMIACLNGYVFDVPKAKTNQVEHDGKCLILFELALSQQTRVGSLKSKIDKIG